MKLYRSSKLVLGASLLMSFMSYGEDAPSPRAPVSRCEQLARQLQSALQEALPDKTSRGVAASLHLPGCSWQGAAGPVLAGLQWTATEGPGEEPGATLPGLASSSVYLPEQHATLVVLTHRDDDPLPGVATRKLLKVLTPP
ncbi:hypothetical protein [Stigmatella erecta]|uniref:Uncharacterized protein n=1 Tax=Stigmatella erecta TaxID=83460 RepID=A0A1I0DAR1_9BACT|nr:hypothetical protein [Stigmatella erecta]SET29368.1 hypothetical protein SAMN05443639_102453 [Stigmatella erecta]